MDLKEEPRRAPGMLEVTVGRGTDLNAALGRAVEVVSRSADEHGLGIMISRVGEGHYVVRVHPAVPHGLVRQTFA